MDDDQTLETPPAQDGDPGNDGQPKPSGTFTQEDVDRIVRERVARAERKWRERFGEDPDAAAEELRLAREFSQTVGVSLKDALAYVRGQTAPNPAPNAPAPQPAKPALDPELEAEIRAWKQEREANRYRRQLGDDLYNELVNDARTLAEDRGTSFGEAMKDLVIERFPRLLQKKVEAERKAVVETIKSKGLHAVDRADDKGNLADTPTLSAEELAIARRLVIKPEAYLKRKLAREKERAQKAR